ncbi:hypothetical protein DITRI_Ditri15bG0017300 [Diplodiscus trichospermus]
MAETIITTILQDTLPKVISIVENQINLHWGFKDELRKLGESLAMTHAFLQDAETRQVHNVAVQIWLKRLGEIASDADDVLDELAYEDLRRKVETQICEKVCNFFSISKNPIIFCFQKSLTVKGINISLNEIYDQGLRFGLQQGVQTMPPLSRGSQITHSFCDFSKIVGREVEVSNIIKLLINSSTQQAFSIISIVGMGGLGKTILAKSVCNNEQIQNYFDKIIWVCVSENFDVGRILQEMFESLTKKTCDMKNRSAMLEKIQKELEGKTYLLALDDVWDEEFNTWEDLRASLLEINKNIRSSILVTTRSEKIAILKDTPQENRYPLVPLGDGECWEIIRNRAFPYPSISSELEAIGKDIARKCRGVPLVANVIGGTMSYKWDIDEWKSLRDSSLWSSLEKDEGIVRVLRLSFDRLRSPFLKQCFAYCSIFSKDFWIEKEQLIQLWMAEGFLQQAKGNCQIAYEDIGNEFFNDLLSNSLFQDVEKDLHGSITRCKMHDSVHNLAQSIRSSKTSNASHIDQLQNEFNGVKPWHSLFSKSSIMHIETDFQGLRVLNFCGANIDLLPDSIGSLKHLRYFDVSKTRIPTLPKSITQLYHLQTLRLVWCNYLKNLPEGMKKLVSLRHLYISDSDHVPDEIGCLTNLRTLPIFDVGRQRRCSIGELGCLSELGGELKVYNLQNVSNKEEARRAKIGDKRKLHMLTYQWESRREGYNNDEEVLEGLEPYSNLNSLTIKYYMGWSNPSWLVKRSLSAFQSIKLVGMNLTFCKNLNNVPTLGLYPNLKFLEIWGLDNVKWIGNEFYVNNNSGDIILFPTLEIFTLGVMKELETWFDVKPIIPVFPSLKELRIEECGKLNSVPAMSRFSSLEKLTIKYCEALSSIRGPFPSTLKKFELKMYMDLGFNPSVEGSISFKEVQAEGCSELSKIGEGLLASTCLRNVSVAHCSNLTSISLNRVPEIFPKLALIGCNELQETTGGPSACSGLEILNIQNCNNLSSVPVVSKFSSLEILSITDCEELSLIGDGLFPSTLKKLEIERCRKLRSIPSIEGGISFLQELQVKGCSQLSKIGGGLLASTCLRRVNIEDCPNLIAIPLNPGAESLLELELRWCKELRDIEGGLSACTKLENLCIVSCPNLISIPSVESFPSLLCLRLRGCEGLTSLPSGLRTYTSLQELDVFNCTNLLSIPEDVGQLHSLRNLSIGRCQNLKTLPEESLGCITSLKTLSLGPFSGKLEEFPGLSSIHHLHYSSLEALKVIGWKRLSSLPDQLQHLTSLNELKISCFHGVKALPEWLGNLSCLRSLKIENCENLEHLPSNKAMQRLSNLKTLELGPFLVELEEFPGFSSIHHLHFSLEDLTLSGWETLSSLPYQLQHFSALKKLSIRNFRGVKALPDWLGNLPSLRELSISHCGNLEHLPSNEAIQCLSNLQRLETSGSPLLAANSAEKSKILHIPITSIR